MITFNLMCDACGDSEAFKLSTTKRKIRKRYYAIKDKDVCPSCVTKAISGLGYVPVGTDLIVRDLNSSEKLKVFKFYF